MEIIVKEESKIIVKEESKIDEWEFPCLVIENIEKSHPSFGRKKPQIILAIEIGDKDHLFNGMVIFKGDAEGRYNGKYIKKFIKSSFYKFKGEVVLRNS